MDLSFVILTWNSESYIEKCFDSLLSSLSATNYSFEIFIVDNGSHDRTVAILKEYQTNYGDAVKLIFLDENVGTTISRNLALKQVSGDYIVVMDSDVEVPKDVFQSLLASFNSSDEIGMVVPRIVYPSGKLQKSTDKFPTVQHKLNRFFRLKTIETQEEKNEVDCQNHVAVDYAISAFWLFKKSLLDEVGLLDEKYFYAPEDVDYCLRVWQCGYQVIYAPQVTVVHHTQEISRGIKFNQAKKEHIKGLLHYFIKHKYFFNSPVFKKQNNKNILFLAYYFPPESSSGSFRPLFFANHLTSLGYNIDVVTAKESDYLPEQPIDQDLLEQLNPKVTVWRSKVFRPREWVINLKNTLQSSKVKEPQSENQESSITSKGKFQKLKDLVTDALATPDPHVGWIISCVRLGSKAIKAKNCEIIWATGSPWSGLIAGVLLKKLAKKKLVTDFRDPWVSNPNFLLRNPILRAVDRFLERTVVKNSDLIIANTERLKKDFDSRYSHLPNLNVAVITNGFENYIPTDAQDINQPLTITHTGALYFSRNPYSLLKALDNLIKSDRIIAKNIKLKFVGGIKVFDSRIEPLLKSLIDIVETIPRVSYDESQRYALNSDILLLIQPNFPLQVPRKIYEYMAVRKPIFSISDKEGATADLMSQFNLGYSSDTDTANIESALLRIYQDWQHNTLSKSTDNRSDPFLNKNLSLQLSQLFVELGKNKVTGALK